MSHKTKICHGIKITMFFCILQYWKSELILQCFNPITHCYFRKCFNRALNKDSWLVASKPELSCADYKTGTFLVYGWQYKQSVTKPTENIKAELLRPGLQGYTKHSSSPKPAKSPAHHDGASATKLLDAFGLHIGFILLLPFWIKCCATCGHIKVSLSI